MSGPLNDSPAKILQYLAVDFGIANLPPTKPWPIYLNNLPDGPNSAIVAIDREGIKHGRDMNSGTVFEASAVEFLFRSNDLGDAYTKARQFLNWMDTTIYMDQVEVGETIYEVQRISRDGEPRYLGPELGASRRFLYSLNTTAVLRLLYEVGTGT